MRDHHRRNLRRGAALALLGAAGCSLVNSFDEVTPLVDGTYAAGDAATLVEASRLDSGSDAPASQSGGAIVVGGRIDTDASNFEYVLGVLDPASGAEITPREKMVVTAIQYDGLRDIWYLFESTGEGFLPGPTEGSILHVRSFDLATRKWTELAKLAVPTVQSYDSIGVVRERIGYVAYTDPDSGSPAGSVEFVTIDTSDPSSPSIVSTRLAVDVTPVGAVSSRSETGPGGTINLVRLGKACTSTCPLELVPVRIPNAGDPVMGGPVELGRAARGAFPSYAAMIANDRDLVVFPRESSDAAAPTTAALFNPLNLDQDGVSTSFFVKDSSLRRAAIAECQSVAFVVGTNSDTDLHAVVIRADGTGKETKISTGHSGQSVYFEPTSSTVIAPFNQGQGTDYTAFRLGGTGDAPTLTRRIAPEWEPPVDLRPLVLGIRQPIPLVCP